MTFEKCAEAHIAAHKAGWRDGRTEAQWRQSLMAYVYPHFGVLSVQSVDISLVLKALEPIWTAKPETASRVRGRIESIIDWATARGYRRGENPARWRGHLENLLPKKSKGRALCGAALSRDWCFHSGAAAGGGCCRARAGVPDPDHGQVQRGARGALE
jgi:hypothetical protein